MRRLFTHFRILRPIYEAWEHADFFSSRLAPFGGVKAVISGFVAIVLAIWAKISQAPAWQIAVGGLLGFAGVLTVLHYGYAIYLSRKRPERHTGEKIEITSATEDVASTGVVKKLKNIAIICIVILVVYSSWRGNGIDVDHTKKSSNAAAPFHLEPGGRPHIFSILDVSKPSGFVAVGPPGGDKNMIPASVLLFVMISNLQSTAVSILGYDLAIGRSAEGPWYGLCPISMRDRKLYWLGLGVNKAREFHRNNFLDYTIPGNAIPPGGGVSGWSAWRCDPRIGDICLSDFFLYTIKDSTGAVSRYVLRYGAPSVGVEAIPSELEVVSKNTENLSSVKWTPNAPCGDGITGEFAP